MGQLLLPLMTNLIRLETLIINDIKSVHMVKLVNQLFSLPVLSSLFIKSIGSIRNQNDIYQMFLSNRIQSVSMILNY
jgi:hypothetical protein